MDNYFLLLTALILEICLDWPQVFYKYLKHPIIWIGSIIKIFDNLLNKDSYSFNLKKSFGILIVLIIVFFGLIFFELLSKFFGNFFFAEIFYIFIIWSFMCTRSLYSHIKQIEKNLNDNNLEKAKKSLSKVVARDTKYLSKKGIIRASLESLSESTSDGIVAPIFWYFIFGIPGLIIFKIVSTLDSMIGYKSKKYLAFGYASAKLDDIFNFIPSRLTGLIFVILSSKPKYTFRIMIKNANRLSSPNAGWPESAFAGALSIRLGGPKTYSNYCNSDKWLNEECKDPTLKNFHEGLELYKKTIFLLFIIIVFFTISQFFKTL